MMAVASTLDAPGNLLDESLKIGVKGVDGGEVSAEIEVGRKVET